MLHAIKRVAYRQDNQNKVNNFKKLYFSAIHAYILFPSNQFKCNIRRLLRCDKNIFRNSLVFEINDFYGVIWTISKKFRAFMI